MDKLSRPTKPVNSLLAVFNSIVILNSLSSLTRTSAEDLGWSYQGVPYVSEHNLSSTCVNVDDFSWVNPMNIDNCLPNGVKGRDFAIFGLSSSLGVTNSNDTEDVLEFQVKANTTAKLVAYAMNIADVVGGADVYVNTALIGRITGSNGPFVPLSDEIRSAFNIRWSIPDGYGILITVGYPVSGSTCVRKTMTLSAPISPPSNTNTHPWYAPCFDGGSSSSSGSVSQSGAQATIGYMCTSEICNVQSNTCYRVAGGGPPEVCMCPSVCSFPMPTLSPGTYQIVFWETNTKTTNAMYLIGLTTTRIGRA